MFEVFASARLLSKGLIAAACAIVLAGHATANEGGSKYTNESEAGVVISSGNSNSESYNVKSMAKSTWDANSLTISGAYLLSQTGSTAGYVESANNWKIGPRYDRALADNYSVFLGHLVEGDKFAGFQQRYSTDAGGKYTFKKVDTENDKLEWFAEAGYRYIHENRIGGLQSITNALRLYSEASKNLTATSTGKLGLEYVPSVSDFNIYKLQGDASLAVVLSSIFSVKTSYQIKYNSSPAPGAKYTDTLFTTSLVAKL